MLALCTEMTKTKWSDRFTNFLYICKAEKTPLNDKVVIVDLYA